jgi:hypothetical protein
MKSPEPVQKEYTAFVFPLPLKPEHSQTEDGERKYLQRKDGNVVTS